MSKAGKALLKNACSLISYKTTGSFSGNPADLTNGYQKMTRIPWN